MDSFITGQPTRFSIQAIKKTTVMSVAKASLELWLENRAGMHQWLALMEQVVVQQLEREMDLLVDSPQERYNRVLQRSPRLFQEIPHRHIAQYLRMSPETLSRIKKS